MAISWLAPEDDGGAIVTGYKITYNDVEEKFGEQNFRAFSEMRGEFFVYRP